MTKILLTLIAGASIGIVVGLLIVLYGVL